MATIAVERDEEQSWGDWRAALRTRLRHGVASFDGWGKCYAAGLAPHQAIACRDKGEGRDMVVEYCSTKDVKRSLVFA